MLYGSLVLLPIMLQTLLGYPSLPGWHRHGAARRRRPSSPCRSSACCSAKVDPRQLLAAGLLLGAFTLFWLGNLNLHAGYWDIFWPQFLQGIGMGLLFVPLTTITMDAIPREQMGNATSLFNLMRNIGGSIGIASATTFLARNQQALTTRLVSHVSPYDVDVQARLAALKRAFMAAGADAATALQQSQMALAGMVAREAAMLSFVQVFRMLGFVFLLSVVLVSLMRAPRGKPGGPPAAH